ncbi:MAG: UMP kinase [Candidatus Woesearchaeota archaeon]
MKTIVLSLGGSVVHPGKINLNFLKDFKKLVMRSKSKFIIIVGGGVICRDYINAAKKLSKCRDRDCDWIGIRSTELNAELVRSMFSDVTTDTIQPDYTIKRKIPFKKVLVGCGYIPGHSSDWDAVNYAIKYDAKEIINMSNIEYVYDKDPNKFKNVKKLDKISWKDFRKLVGNEWKAGLNMPFDPTASKLAHKKGIKVKILKGTDLRNLEKCLKGNNFKGTEVG